MTAKLMAALVAAVITVGACGPTIAGDMSAAITAALEHSERPAADRARDATRKPAEVIQFSGIEPGMTVLDVFSGGGYYTEILSHYVGSEGKVIAHNNQTYIGFVEDEEAARYAGDRLTNVERVLQEANDLDVGESIADAALLVLSYHDIYYHEDDGSWPDIDRDTFLGNIYRALKPGATVLVIDHRAPAGSPAETGTTLHRIDPALVMEGMAANGFKLELEANFFSNPEDPGDISVFDPSIRGRTDRFVHLYRKPSMEE